TLNGSAIAPARIQRINFAAVNEQAPVTFLDSPRRLRLRLAIVVQSADRTTLTPIPLTVVVSLRERAAVVGSLSGTGGTPEASTGLQRLQNGLQLSILRLALNQNLAAEQRDRRLSMDFAEESSQGGPYLVVRLR